MSLKVKYANIADDQYENMSVSSDDGQPFSNASGLQGDGFADTPWATLEPNS